MPFTVRIFAFPVPYTVTFWFNVTMLPEFIVSFLKVLTTLPPNDWFVPEKITVDLALFPL